jgi:aspartate beta-hydroxylase
MDAARAAAEALARQRLAARELAAQGRLLDAERAFAALLQAAPDDVDALNFLALCAHGRRRADEALALLARAQAAAPDDAATLINLGVLLREQGRLDDAAQALRHALRQAPDLFIARLRLGEVLEAQGRGDEALPVYFRAIANAQQQGQWRNDATTPPGLRAAVRHAIGFVAEGRRVWFGALLAPLRERHGAAALARVEKCLAAYLGVRPLPPLPPRQRPTFLHFPDLPSPRFFERALFPWYEALESQAGAIREELLALLAADHGFEPFLGHVGGHGLQDYLRGERGTPAWNAFFFHRHGRRMDDNAARCPRTAAILDALPLCRIREHAPEVCFSLLTPGSHILPHHGVTNTRVVTHLALIVPEDCALVVAGEARAWQEGRCFSFDDTYEHEAWNRSGSLRVVLLMDAWNPYLSEAERDALTVLVGAIGDFNRAGD